MYATDFSRIRKARVEHECSAYGCLIKPGDRYFDEVIPPWTMIQDDVDDEGYPRGTRNGEWTHMRRHLSHEDHNTDGLIDLYHRTNVVSAAEIYMTGKMVSKEQGWVYFSNRETGQAEGYGDTVVHIRIPRAWATLDDEFPNGEQHYKVKVGRIGRTTLIGG